MGSFIAEIGGWSFVGDFGSSLKLLPEIAGCVAIWVWEMVKQIDSYTG